MVCITICRLHPRGQASGYSPCPLIIDVSAVSGTEPLVQVTTGARDENAATDIAEPVWGLINRSDETV